MIILKLIFITFFLILIAGCSDGTDSNKQQSLAVSTVKQQQLIKVAVVNYPLKYFSQQIGMDEVKIIFLAENAKEINDPAYWKPTAEDVRAYQQADIIFLNGANYAHWINYVTLPEDRLVNTSNDFAEQYIPVKDNITHSHGPKGDHSHGSIAFTTWLDMQQAIRQADSIKQALIQLKPESEQKFNINYQRLKLQLETLDQQLKSVTHKIRDIPVFFSHPVYQYFQRAYHIRGVSLHWEADIMPDEAAFAELLEKSKVHAAKWMIWEDEPLTEIEIALEKMHIKSVVFQPISMPPADGDFISVMQDNIHQLELIVLQ